MLHLEKFVFLILIGVGGLIYISLISIIHKVKFLDLLVL